MVVWMETETEWTEDRVQKEPLWRLVMRLNRYEEVIEAMYEIHGLLHSTLRRINAIEEAKEPTKGTDG